MRGCCHRWRRGPATWRGLQGAISMLSSVLMGRKTSLGRHVQAVCRRSKHYPNDGKSLQDRSQADGCCAGSRVGCVAKANCREAPSCSPPQLADCQAHQLSKAQQLTRAVPLDSLGDLLVALQQRDRSVCPACSRCRLHLQQAGWPGNAALRRGGQAGLAGSPGPGWARQP